MYDTLSLMPGQLPGIICFVSATSLPERWVANRRYFLT